MSIAIKLRPGSKCRPTTWTFRSAWIAFILVALSASAFVSGNASAEDIVLFDGSPFGEGQQPPCFDWPKPRYYTTRAVTFVFDWNQNCEDGDIKYDVEVEREYHQGTLELALGYGDPNWSYKRFVGVCPGPCSAISLFAEHPWHESADYWFYYYFEGPPHPEHGGGYLRSWGNAWTQCSSDGVLAGCDGWRMTAHIPDSPDDIPRP